MRGQALKLQNTTTVHKCGIHLYAECLCRLSCTEVLKTKPVVQFKRTKYYSGTGIRYHQRMEKGTMTHGQMPNLCTY